MRDDRRQHQVFLRTAAPHHNGAFACAQHLFSFLSSCSFGSYIACVCRDMTRHRREYRISKKRIALITRSRGFSADGVRDARFLARRGARHVTSCFLLALFSAFSHIALAAPGGCVGDRHIVFEKSGRLCAVDISTINALRVGFCSVIAAHLHARIAQHPRLLRRGNRLCAAQRRISEKKKKKPHASRSRWFMAATRAAW